MTNDMLTERQTSKIWDKVLAKWDKKSYLLWTIDTGLTKQDTHQKTKMIFQGSAKQPEKVSQYSLNDS